MWRRVFTFVFVTIGLLFAANPLLAQREREIQPAAEESQYSRKFFTQLRGVFGRFRDTDLRRAFEAAQPIQCSELVNDPGVWRTVAFFNEKRELGDWYRSSLDEVKSDLSAFIFKGACQTGHGSVQLTTKFPVSETIEAYNRGRIPFEQIEVNVNAAVRASFDDQTQAYAFDLPYLFLVSNKGAENVYSLDPPYLDERTRYASDVVNHWECKSVTAEAVTYQFLICKTTTEPRDTRMRSQQRAAFGSTAYFILSDGKEALSSVKLTFSDANDAQHTIADASRATPDAPAPDKWILPDSDEKLVDLIRDGFQIRFPAQMWRSRIGSAQVLYGQKVSSLKSSQPPAGADLCIWLPGDASLLDGLLTDKPDVVYLATLKDQDGQSAASIVFDMKTRQGSHLGSLQCVFPRKPSAAGIEFERWMAIAGDSLIFEIKP
jgi:hypothetical protein